MRVEEKEGCEFKKRIEWERSREVSSPQKMIKRSTAFFWGGGRARTSDVVLWRENEQDDLSLKQKEDNDQAFRGFNYCIFTLYIFYCSL